MIKFNITDEMKDKFHTLMKKTLNRELTQFCSIEDLGEQYSFEFEYSNGDVWHFELDKQSNKDGWYFLYCSTQRINVRLKDIKDLKMFCTHIQMVYQMQKEYVNNKI